MDHIVQCTVVWLHVVVTIATIELNNVAVFSMERVDGNGYGGYVEVIQGNGSSFERFPQSCLMVVQFKFY